MNDQRRMTDVANILESLRRSSTRNCGSSIRGRWR